jgi:hypothetical protein
MKIAENDPYFVGEGYQTLPDKAVLRPYAIFPMRPYARNRFSEELPMPLSQHHKGMKYHPLPLVWRPSPSPIFGEGD